MTSTLARRTYNIFAIQIPCFSISHRSIYATRVAYKRKAKVDVDDLFSEDAFSEELVKRPSTAHTSKSTPSGQSELLSPEEAKGTKAKKRPLAPSVRLQRLNEFLSFTEERIGRSPKVHTPLVRQRSWLTMLDLAMNEEQVRKIVDLFPAYINGGGIFPSHFAEAFAKRCEQLSCPQVSLEVFGDFAKYKLALTLPAGRWLIHSLHVQHPISSTLLAASFFHSYGLPEISQDLPTAAMVAVACYNDRHKTEKTIKFAAALFPHIRNMWDVEKIGSAKNLDEARVNKWVVWSMMKLNRAMQRETGKGVVAPENLSLRILKPSPTTHINVEA